MGNSYIPSDKIVMSVFGEKGNKTTQRFRAKQIETTLLDAAAIIAHKQAKSGAGERIKIVRRNDLVEKVKDLGLQQGAASVVDDFLARKQTLKRPWGTLTVVGEQGPLAVEWDKSVYRAVLPDTPVKVDLARTIERAVEKAVKREFLASKRSRAPLRKALKNKA